MDITKFTEKEFQKNLEEIYSTYTKEIEISNEKKAYLLGGQPGAGKSGLTTLLKSNDKNLILINGDDFRKLHPHFKELQETYGKESVEYTKTFAGKMTEALINKLSDEGYNLVIEGTLRTSTVPLKTQQELSNKGYQVEMAVIQVRPEISYLGTLSRYEEMMKAGIEPRATLKKDHQVVVDNIADNLSELYKTKQFSNIRIFNRESECLYSMKDKPEIDPGTLIKKEFERDLTKEEKEQILKGYDKVLEDMKQRKAPEEEIKIILMEKENSLNNKTLDPFEAMLKERENSLPENKISDSWEDKVSKGNSLTLGDD